MIKIPDIGNKLGVSLALSSFFITFVSHAGEYSLDAKIDSRAEYNDNIFLTNESHDSVKGLIITPSLSGIIKEKNWETKLSARIKSHNYSDDNLNSNDQYFDFTGKYLAERNIFSLNVNYDLASNLNATSDDFGVTGKRVNRKSQSITPQYTRLISERLVLILSYAYADVDYLEAEDTVYTPYESETGSASVIYNLTEKDKLTIGLSAVDYTSRNDQVTYQLFITRFGIDHKFAEKLSVDFLLGFSRRESTFSFTQPSDFFGTTILLPQEIDSTDRGLVFDAGIKQLFERSKLEVRISRNNTANSFGGLDEVSNIKLSFDEKLSSLWRYDIDASYGSVKSISTGASVTDRNTLFLESVVFYSINLNWSASVSYRYVQREFNNETSVSSAPHSNRIYLGLTYNFPSLSTF